MTDMTSEPRHTATDEHPVTANELNHVVKVHDLRVVVGAIATVVAVTVSAWMLLQSEARAQANIVTHEVVQRLVQHEKILQDHIVTSREERSGVQRDIHEIHRDIRDLYKTITTGRPSPRLERPIDGGN